MTALAAENNFALFCYGTVAGGFLSDRWLGVSEPEHPLENRSLTKYKLIIDDIGGWDLFQALLAALRRIADRHGTDIATIASAAMLRRPSVAAVIVGARNRDHLAANLAISDTQLSDGISPKSKPSWPRPRSWKGTSTRSNGIGRDVMGAS